MKIIDKKFAQLHQNDTKLLKNHRSAKLKPEQTCSYLRKTQKIVPPYSTLSLSPLQVYHPTPNFCIFLSTFYQTTTSPTPTAYPITTTSSKPPTPPGFDPPLSSPRTLPLSPYLNEEGFYWLKAGEWSCDGGYGGRRPGKCKNVFAHHIPRRNIPPPSTIKYPPRQVKGEGEWAGWGTRRGGSGRMLIFTMAMVKK